ncbi:hypothetical protein [Crassaminicella profunda]|uniref:hypothetical protein n=1 Tax=Crassaminicella profunda TaxID=1286698 RepID=UPI001CA64579|nr:hypothetical protein [Crassaminicella profunda]QZY55655.1 hypothetical protein K7H06_01165 [Crassaminicella profunda]
MLHENCNGCYALKGDQCRLGYKIEPLFFSICYITEGYKPLESCPKPENKEIYLKIIHNKVKNL